MGALDFIKLEDTSDVEFVFMDIPKGKPDVVVRTQHVHYEIGEYIFVITSSNFPNISRGVGASASRRSRKWLASSSIDPVGSLLEPRITKISDEDVGGSELIASWKKQAAGKLKNVSAIGKEKEGASELPLVEDGDSIYIHEWSVCRKDLMKKPSVCRDSSYHLTTPADKAFLQQLLNEDVMKAMIVNVF
ncbi:hypothetical protein L1987_40688 [Smallanthus sonchifolius]|uniref:Uncharacterized protein n=1 Tax=Smallanthus sonchifolius TaxID=185202 RepID=A0ACB9GUX1_9ASTR|nr:hypothetical protein L1987_40688 [Smallanthus sonchifolius]